MYGREVLVELISLHARILKRMPVVQALLAFGIGLFVVPHVTLLVFASWCALSIGIEATRATYAAYVLRRAGSVDPARAHRYFVSLAFAAGLVAGVGAALCFPHLPIAEQATLAIVLFAMPAAGVAVSQSSRYIIAAYCLSILLPATISWGLLYPHQAIAVLLMSMLYCGFIILVAAEGEQLLLRSVVIRHERDRLVRDLEQRNADVRVAMERAEQAALSRARVLATASHDLRQPLHALSIYSAVLAAQPQPDQLREVAANIDQIVRSLGSLLHGLLDLSRLTAGHYVAEQKPVDLDVVIAGVCGEYQRMAIGKGLALRIELRPIRLIGDAVAIGRIARNLLDNAIKYTDRGTVNVTTHVDDSADSPVAVVTVADSGAGIPADEQARIYEEFYQTDNPTRDRSKGVGLGLAIVKRLCELIGAQILLESAPGCGATFRVRLHGVSVSCVKALPGSAALEAGLSEGCRIYLVDDEADIVRSTQILLTSWGMQVASADSADAAERLFLESGMPDLLITDLRLRGECNGAELIRRMRKHFPSFPVLVITGEVSAAAAAQIDELGAALLYKPITAESLHATVRHLLAGGERVHD